jgi:DNA-directed RNA polymerase specialized sigma24 family protein
MRGRCHTGIMGLAPPTLLDENGQPLDARIQSALHRLLPRFQLAFPVLRDEAVIAGLFEDAGRRIVEAERRLGRPMDKLHGYAWVTLRSVAFSHLRSARGQLDQATLGPAESTVVLAAAPAWSGTSNEIEGRILLAEILATLTLDEQRLLLMKKAGFPSRDIGARLRKSPKAVDMMYSRLRSRILVALGLAETSVSMQPDEGHNGPNRDQE